MGVRGLTSYVEGNRQFFTDTRLKDSCLVIDGCSLYFRLYFNTGLDQARGGDYDAFATLLRQFFAALAECNIQPFVVLDGGMDHQDKKFKTLVERTQSKIREAHALSRGSHGFVLPLLSRQVFVQVLSELSVPLVQCISEADFEIASLANHWGCPVLTNDSDFYIFDLRGGYLPFSFFEWNNTRGKAKERYIPARLFIVNRFCSHFNHMNKQLLPLFAVITGNDYTQSKMTEIFFSRVALERVPGGRKSGRSSRIEGFLLWLSRFTSPVDALEEVLEILGGERKGSWRTQLQARMKDYQLPHTSLLAQFFSSPQPAVLDLHGLPALVSQPEWFLKMSASGTLPSFVLDVLVLQKVLLMAQVENSQLPSSHSTSRSIRQTLYWLLLGDVREQGQQKGRGRGRSEPQSQGDGGQHCHCSCVIEEYDRLNLNLKKNTVEALKPKSVPQLSLTTIEKTSIQVRMQVLLETMGMMGHTLLPFPPNLRLPLCVTRFWMKNSKPKPDSSLLGAMLLGMVFGELSWRASHPDDPLFCSKSAASVCQQLSQLRVNPGERRGLNLGVAHLLSQWQSCLWTSISLNKLLLFPMPEPQCARVFSGTLVHGLEAAVRGGHQPESLLAGDPTALHLYSEMLEALTGPAAPATSGERRGRGHSQVWQRGGGIERGGRGYGGRGRGGVRGGRGDGGRGRSRSRGGLAPPRSGFVNKFELLTVEDDW